MKENLPLAGLIISFIFIVSGCELPENTSLPDEAVYAMPLVNETIYLEDLLEWSEDVSAKVDEEGRMELVYSTTILDESLRSLLPAIPILPEFPVPDTAFNLALDEFTDFRLEKALLEQSVLRFRFQSDRAEDIRINIEIPEIKVDGSPFRYEYLMNYDGTMPFEDTTSLIDLSGAIFESSTNTMTIKYDARISNGDRITLPLMTMSLGGISLEYAEGWTPLKAFSISDAGLRISVFDAWENGLLLFEDPSLTFDISHTIGFPLAFQIKNVQLMLKDGSRRTLSGIAVNSVLELDYPGLDEKGLSKSTSITFDRSNSNIHTLFNEKVTAISYEILATVNPDNQEALTGFVTKDSYFNLDVHANIPLRLKLEDLQFRDTLEFEPFAIPALDSAELKVITRNSFPLGASLSMEFLDSEDQAISLSMEPIRVAILPGEIIENGKTLPSPETIQYFRLNEEDLSKWGEVNKIVVAPFFDVLQQPSGEWLNLFEDQFISVKMGVKFSL